MKTVAVLALALGAVGAAAPAVGAGSVPHIVRAEFYEDLEDGPRYNVDAGIKGEAEKVTARSGSLRATGRLSGHISGPGSQAVWFFRDHEFVKQVKADLYADGFALVAVKAVNGNLKRKKVCELDLEPDPAGDYASGDCNKT